MVSKVTPFSNALDSAPCHAAMNIVVHNYPKKGPSNSLDEMSTPLRLEFKFQYKKRYKGANMIK